MEILEKKNSDNKVIEFIPTSIENDSALVTTSTKIPMAFAKKVAEMSAFLSSVGAIVEAMGLPKEATVSVLQTMQAVQKIEENLRRQRKLTDNERRALIQSREPVSPLVLPKFVAYSEMHRIPLENLANIEGKPFATAVALREKVTTDLRIRKSMVITEETSGLMENGMLWAKCKWKLTYWSGETFDGIGTADSIELGIKRRGNVGLMDVVHMARTRGERHALRTALALPIVLAEDVEEGQKSNGKIIDVTPTTAAAYPNNLGEFVAKAQKELGMNFPQVKKSIMAIFKIDVNEVANWKEAWIAMEKMHKDNKKE